MSLSSRPNLPRLAGRRGGNLLATPAVAQMELKIIAPAAPGGGWDQTARSMQQALIAEKLGEERAGDQHRRRRRHRRPRAVRQQRQGRRQHS